MKASTLIVILFLAPSLGWSQTFTSMDGDWIRVKAEYMDQQSLPNNHFARVYQRYHFEKDKVHLVAAGQSIPATYKRTGSNLNIAPVQSFVIEQYTGKALTLVEAGKADPLRYYLIPTDSFQVSGRMKYAYEISGADTIYTSTVGIEPIYTKGDSEFLGSIMRGFESTAVAFNYTFVVKKDGTIGEVAVQASSNEKKNSRLIQLVKKTSGKWIPATFKGKPIDVKMKGSLSLKVGTR